MASEYFGLNRGDPTMNEQKVQVGSSTNSTDVEVRVDGTKSLTRYDVTLLVEAILRRINSGNDANSAG